MSHNLTDVAPKNTFTVSMGPATILLYWFFATFRIRCLCHAIKSCRYGTGKIWKTVRKVGTVVKLVLMCLHGTSKRTVTQKKFQSSTKSQLSFCFTSFFGLGNSYHLLNKSDSILKPIMTLLFGLIGFCVLILFPCFIILVSLLRTSHRRNPYCQTSTLLLSMFNLLILNSTSRYRKVPAD